MFLDRSLFNCFNSLLQLLLVNLISLQLLIKQSDFFSLMQMKINSRQLRSDRSSILSQKVSDLFQSFLLVFVRLSTHWCPSVIRLYTWSNWTHPRSFTIWIWLSSSAVNSKSKFISLDELESLLITQESRV